MAGIVFQPGIGSLAGIPDAFLIDRRGVLHHGRPAESLAAREKLRRAGKLITARALCRQHAIEPDDALPAFRW